MTDDAHQQSRTMIRELEWTYRHAINGTLAIVTSIGEKIVVLERAPDTMFGGRVRVLTRALFRKFYRRLDGGDYFAVN